MFRNYLAAALRNLLRNRLYAAINIIGLAVGFAAAILIALFVRDEFSYDKWIPGHERTYMVTSREMYSNTKPLLDAAPGATAELMKQEFPQIEAIVRLSPGNRETVALRRGDVEFMEKLQFAEPNLFDVLPLRAVVGDLSTALQNPDSIVLTRALARKYFGRDDVIGETIEMDRKAALRITAVLEDLPSDTHLDLGAIVSSRSPYTAAVFRDKRPPVTYCLTYLRLAPGASAETLREALPAFAERHGEFNQLNAKWTLDIVPLAAIHFSRAAVAQMKPRGDAGAVMSAAAIALLIVAIAGVNFVNLTTARQMRRAVEVGVRKTSGALRRHLLIQFIGESVIYTVLGVTLAVLAAKLLLPFFNGFLEREIVFNVTRDWMLIGMTTFAVGVLAGAYPAVSLARLPVAAVMKGGPARPTGNRARQILVASQFSILMVLALVATAIYRQADYGKKTALRFDMDQTLIIGGACNTAFASAVGVLPGVRGVACSNGSPVLPSGLVMVVRPNGQSASGSRYGVDFDFFRFYGAKPIAGRFFSREFGADAVPADTRQASPSVVVVNESMARALGYSDPAEAVGVTLRWEKTRFAEFAGGQSQIIGVAPDIARGGIHEAMAPAVYWIDPVIASVLSVKLSGNTVPETVAAIDRLWKQLGPPSLITRIFLDRQVDALYREVVRLSETVGIFAAVAVFVACLGLFGLAASTAESRTKEIGVRKALGASPRDIVGMMLWEFARPVLWASLVAWPVAYVIMNRWLEGFADRVDLGLWTFPATTGLALAIAGLTILGHAILVARTEPVAALRYE